MAIASSVEAQWVVTPPSQEGFPRKPKNTQKKLPYADSIPPASRALGNVRNKEHTGQKAKMIQARESIRNNVISSSNIFNV